jgi:autotransporter-associated beta strand protein
MISRWFRGRRLSTYRPCLELLESRLTPAVHTWTGAGADTNNNNWSDPANWSGGAPSAGESNVSLVFSGIVSYKETSRASNNDINGLTVIAVQFTEKIYTPRPELGGYHLTGNAIRLLGLSTISEKSSIVPTDLDGHPIGLTEFGSDQISLPVVEQPVTSVFGLSNGHTYEVDFGNNLDISGGITSSGAFCSLDKTGDGELDLDSPGNSFSDSITVDAGTLKLGSVPAASLVPVTVAAGATLSTDTNTLGSLFGSGNVKASGTLTIGTDNNDAGFDGVISGTGKVIKAGLGTYSLGGVNTFTGSLEIKAGTIQQARTYAIPSVAVTIDAGATFDLGALDDQIGSLSGAGTVTGTGQNFATLTTGVDKTSTTFTGNIVSGINLVKDGTGTFTLGGANGFVGTLTVMAGTLAQGADNAVPQTDVEVHAGATLDLHTYNATIRTLTGAGTVTSHGSCTLTVGRPDSWSFDGDISGDIALVKIGTGTFTLNAVNDFNGGGIGLIIMSGAVDVGTNDAIPFTVTVNVDALARLDLRGHKEVLGSLTGAGTIDSTDGVEPVFFAKPLPGTLTVGANNASSSWDGDISGDIALVKVGTGTFTLNSVNTYTGSTTVQAGTLILGINNAVPPNSCVVALDATVDVHLHNETLGSLAGAGTVLLSDPTLTVGADNTSTTFSGVISGNGNLTKVGTGMFTLSGANTYTGQTSVQAGILQVTGSLSPSSTISVAPGAQLTGASTLTNVTVNGTSGDNTFVIDTTGVTLNGVPIVTTPYTNLTINGLGGNDTFDILGTNAGSITTLNAGSNTNVFNVGSAANTLDPIQGTVDVEGAGNTKLVVNDSGTATINSWDIGASSIDRYPFGGSPPAVPQVTSHNLSNVTVNTGAGKSFIRVEGTAAGTTTIINGNGFIDQVAVENFSDSLGNDFNGPLQIHDANPFNLSINDGANQDVHNYSLTTGLFLRDGMQPITFGSNVGLVALGASRGGGTVAVPSFTGNSFAVIIANTGDTVTIGSKASQGLSGINADVGVQALQGQKPQVVLDDSADPNPRTMINLGSDAAFGYQAGTFGYVIAGMADSSQGRGRIGLELDPGSPVSIVGGLASDSFHIRDFKGAPALQIDGRGGTNTLDYSFFVGDVQVDLQPIVNPQLGLGYATGITGGIAHISNVTGSIGNDLIVGDANPNTLIGGTGRNILIGGAGPDMLTGSVNQDNILIGGTTLWDKNLPDLMLIMHEWLRTDLNFDQRMSDISSGGVGIVNSVLTNTGVALNNTTVSHDSSVDTLTEPSTNTTGRYWLFVDADDIVPFSKHGKNGDHITKV